MLLRHLLLVFFALTAPCFGSSGSKAKDLEAETPASQTFLDQVKEANGSSSPEDTKARILKRLKNRSGFNIGLTSAVTAFFIAYNRWNWKENTDKPKWLCPFGQQQLIYMILAMATRLSASKALDTDSPRWTALTGWLAALEGLAVGAGRTYGLFSELFMRTHKHMKISEIPEKQTKTLPEIIFKKLKRHPHIHGPILALTLENLTIGVLQLKDAYRLLSMPSEPSDPSAPSQETTPEP